MSWKRNCIAATAVLVAVASSVMGLASTSSDAGIAPPAVAATNEPDSAAIVFDDSPEGRLLQALDLLQSGEVGLAQKRVRALIEEHPGFSLAQLLHADLLAARAGVPRAFGIDDSATVDPRDRRLALREEAVRRLQARRDPVPKGHVPREFVQVPTKIRHAVAIDASRSRLYLFENTPQGLQLKRDLYVSVGKQGVGKQLEGDQRTPLGLYWVTVGVKGPMRDARLGQAALGFNYPNAWDRELGRTGHGLYLHGVPPEMLARVPQATDGCVAMANDDAVWLLQTVDADTTPVLISHRLQWLPPQSASAAHAEFLQTYRAWASVRERGQPKALRAWYEKGQAPFEAPGAADPESASVLAWAGDGDPVMIVTTRHPALGDGAAGLVRQYWRQRNGRWQVFFDGPVSMEPRKWPGDGARSVRSGTMARERQG